MPSSEQCKVTMSLADTTGLFTSASEHFLRKEEHGIIPTTLIPSSISSSEALLDITSIIDDALALLNCDTCEDIDNRKRQ
jgi:hypothetical protein